MDIVVSRVQTIQEVTDYSYVPRTPVFMEGGKFKKRLYFPGYPLHEDGVCPTIFGALTAR